MKGRVTTMGKVHVTTGGNMSIETASNITPKSQHLAQIFPKFAAKEHHLWIFSIHKMEIWIFRNSSFRLYQ